VLLVKIKEDLLEFKEANRGRKVMSDSIEKMGYIMMNNEIPLNWTEENGVGFLSVKPLSNWINDLRDRVDFLKEWENDGTPIC